MINRLPASCLVIASLVLFTSHLMFPSAHAVSFNCAKAYTATEKSICSHTELGELDSAMAKVYRSVRAQTPASKRMALIKKQRAWLKKKRDRCGNEACIAQAYKARQVELQTLLNAMMNSVSQVALGEYHSCTLSKGGALRCRGKNDSGQVGNGKSGGNIPRPTRVIASGVTAVATGNSHSCALLGDKLKCWGSNYYGEVGNGNAGKDVSRPTKVISRGVKAVATGGGHSCAVVADNLQCWGNNEFGEIGTGTPGTMVPRPVKIMLQSVTGVSAGENHTCAIASGALYCWGYNYNGQVGNGTSHNSVASPILVIEAGVTAVSAGFDHTCAIVDGALYCWGESSDGEIGDGTHGDDVLRPVKVIAGGVTAVSAGNRHTCAIVDAALYCWGSNFYGEIGKGGPGSDVLFPVKVIENGVTSISAWGKHSCAVTYAQQICWRYSGYGEIDPKSPSAAKVSHSTPKVSKVTKVLKQPKQPANLSKFAGTYKGAMISSGTEFVITRLFVNSAEELVGEYTMLPYSGSSKGEESGSLGSCKRLPDSEFICRWQDKYGYGFLALQFDAGAQEFRGIWRSGDSLPHMKREYWLEQTVWNGFRQ